MSQPASSPSPESWDLPYESYARRTSGVNENACIAGPKRDAGQNWHDPMHIWCTSPGEPQLPNGEEDCTKNNNAGNSLWRYLTGFRVLAVAIDGLAEDGFACDGDEDTGSDADEGESADSR
ncbi:unnamed protein product [Aspergillus oryzae]|uniref:Unnamed protein product n=2 Tax=Aspergillus oryzae TaxID=5062 RepID=A0AAN5C3D3_ASPOZ|nr:unnamed protein product [Aspergillus oryzae]GMF95092.1 unnamed protein product [Aspergillus oryzae]GMG13486.1 unnamed protein product [Aspergillus oryzae]GMG36179.1 unnamed protein product [Aspergillus oryzae]GMG46063.1 unnamed protein product [Aspergillus oryzae var. brunneus]